MTNTHIITLSTNNDKIHIFNAFTINFYLNNSYLFQNNNLLQSQLFSCDIKNSMNFVQLPQVNCGIKQIIEAPTRVTWSSSTITDAMLAKKKNKKASLMLNCLIINLFVVQESLEKQKYKILR